MSATAVTKKPRVDEQEAEVFRAPIVKQGAWYCVHVPEKVTRALSAKGVVAILVSMNDGELFDATLVPRGGGLHRIHLNGTVRKRAKVEVGDRVRLAIRVDPTPPELETPEDMARALRADDALETYRRFPRGKRNHIVKWVEAAVHEDTREKRIAKVVEVALAAREKAADRGR